MSRRVVAAMAIGEKRTPYVVCDDGAVFMAARGGWLEFPPVPGTEAGKDIEPLKPERTPQRRAGTIHPGYGPAGEPLPR